MKTNGYERTMERTAYQHLSAQSERKSGIEALMLIVCVGIITSTVVFICFECSFFTFKLNKVTKVYKMEHIFN